MILITIMYVIIIIISNTHPPTPLLCPLVTLTLLIYTHTLIRSCRLLKHYLHKPTTQRGLDSCSDKELHSTTIAVAMATKREFGNMTDVYTDDAQLKVCGACGTIEEFVGTLMRCSSCLSAVYCNKECQKQHWKVHKKACQRMKEEKKQKEAEMQANIPEEYKTKTMEETAEYFETKTKEETAEYFRANLNLR